VQEGQETIQEPQDHSSPWQMTGVLQLANAKLTGQVKIFPKKGKYN
jgi:hypothetical protein